MNKLQKLQADYRAGKITKAVYLEKLAQLLTDEDVTQAEHDAAKEFDPQDPDDEPRYSQNDVNKIVAKKATQVVKKALKAAGVEIDSAQVNDRNLMEHVAQLALAGQGKLPTESDTQKQLKEANARLAKMGDAESTVRNLTLENAVLRTASKYNPVNPSQVVRALGDYADLIEYDDDGKLVSKSVERAIKKIAEAEPNLFTAAPESGGDPNNRGGFQGKPPGGGQPPAAATKQQAKIKDGLALLGITKQE